jgi:hypothetical protein
MIIVPPTTLGDDHSLSYVYQAPAAAPGVPAAASSPPVAQPIAPGPPPVVMNQMQLTAQPSSQPVGGVATVSDSKPGDGDIGYAIPIEIVFRAPNKEGLTYVYDVVHKTPLNQLYRIEMQSVSSMPNQRDDSTVEFKAMFLFVPKLFQALDAVRQLIKELQSPAPLAKVAAAPPAKVAAAK